jgi:subtilisin family serine protease
MRFFLPVLLLISLSAIATEPISQPLNFEKITDFSQRRINPATRIHFEDLDLTDQANNPNRIPNPSPVLNPDIKAAIELELNFSGSATPQEKRLTREAPWSDDIKTANANSMNDNYVSLATSPLSGNLYCVFESPDLGGSDRDLHIAESTDDGATWTTYDMPSFTEDEYSPELAIDNSGYLHVTWIREDGVVLRTRSAAPDAPDNWEWVKGLIADEPMQTPSIDVSGGGSFSTVLIASNWLTINWDLYQYEWTIIWMWSTNGGETIEYDYFQPDGYPDYWPDVAIDGAHASMVNGEQDYYTGEIEIVLAQDAINGGFTNYLYLSQWTYNNCQFPQVARDGDNIYTVFQHNWDDGIGNIDGDIIYCFSWDAGEAVYGPYELVADEYQSVGPTVYTDNGVVGVAWLDAEENDDQFYIAATEAGGNGHPDNFGNIYYVSDQDNAEPQFHNVTGSISDGGLNVAWVDRRDYPTEGMNIYSSSRTVQPDLSPFIPDGWGDSLIANMIRGERQSGYLSANDSTYVSFAFISDGLGNAENDFDIQLLLDGLVIAEWTLEGGLPTGYYLEETDFAIMVNEGNHTLAWSVDTDNVIDESDETDNIYELNLNWIDGDPYLRLNPNSISHYFETTSLPLANPPVKTEIHLPKISDRLATASQRGGLHPVVFKPTRSLDLQALDLRGTTTSQRRKLVTDAARTVSSDNKTELTSLFNQLGIEPTELWLSGMFSAELSEAQINALADDSRIGWLWLDDLKSQPYGKPTENPRSIEWHLNDIGAPEAWSMGFDGSGMIVGLIDSGVAYDHPDLVNHMWDGGAEFPNHGWDAVDDDDDPYDGDADSFHGTHTAGLIVGDGTGGYTTGAAPGATLMALRAIPGTYNDLIEALQFGLDNGAWIFSFSAGWPQAANDLKEAIRETAVILGNSEYPWICAAGNGDNVGGHYPVPTDISLPGSCPNPWYGDGGHSGVITVGATTSSQNSWQYSSYGPTEWSIPDTEFNDYPYPLGLMKPDVSAPGDGIISTTPGGYIEYSGTSMATPLVASAVAILFQAIPTLSVVELAEILETTATDIGSLGRDNLSGAGIINIPAALGSLPIGESEQFYICNDGPLPLVIESYTEDADWLNISIGQSSIAPFDSLLCHAWFTPEGLTDGTYNETAIIVCNDIISEHPLQIRMIIGDDISGINLVPSRAAVSVAPNPFNPKTEISFNLTNSGNVDLKIFNLRGELVCNLVDSELQSGRHEIIWNGLDSNGQQSASGTYFARLETPDGKIVTGKLMLVK